MKYLSGIRFFIFFFIVLAASPQAQAQALADSGDAIHMGTNNSAQQQERQPDSCAWAPPADIEQTSAVLKDALQRVGFELFDWSLSINGTKADLDFVSAAGDKASLSMRLDKECRVKYNLSGALPAELKEQISPKALGLQYVKMVSPENPVLKSISSKANMLFSLVGKSMAFRFNLENLLLIGFVFAFLLSILRSNHRKTLLRVDYLVGALLVTWAAMPLFSIPIHEDTTFERAFFAGFDPFGDDFHPPLPFLLNYVAAAVSFHPLILRIIPFIWLLVESLLLMKVSANKAGRLAGFIALTLFACEIRRRNSLPYISDWDLAGAFILSWMLILQRVDKEKAFLNFKSQALIALSIAGGCLSSYMVIPVAVVFVCILYLKYYQNSQLDKSALLPGGILLVFLLNSFYVFSSSYGDPIPPGAGFDKLFFSILKETPIDRAPIMAIPILGGLYVLFKHRLQHSNAFALLSIMAIFFSIILLARKGTMHGAYYIYPAITFMIYASSVFLAGMAVKILAFFRERKIYHSIKLRYLADGAAVLLSLLMLVNFTTAEELSYYEGVENIPTFLSITDINPKPIITNWPNLDRVSIHTRMAYEFLENPKEIRRDCRPEEQGIKLVFDFKELKPDPEDPVYLNGYYLVVESRKEKEYLLEQQAASGCKLIFLDRTNQNALMYHPIPDSEIRFYHCPVM